MQKMPGLLLGVMDRGSSLEQRIARLLEKKSLWTRRGYALAILSCGLALAAVSFGLAALGGTEVMAQGSASSKFKSFEVASIKENKSDDPVGSMNIPMGPTASYTPTGGRFSAKGMPLQVYINFAYATQAYQAKALAEKLPDWAKNTNYDIEARAEGEPTKDDMRAMMLALLAQRFGLKVHEETREVAMWNLELIRPGKIGAALVRHSAGDPCTWQQAKDNPAEDLKSLCGGIAIGPSSSTVGAMQLIGRNTPMSALANSLMGVMNVDKPVRDRTGLEGGYDFRLEYASPDTSTTMQGSQTESGAFFVQALETQFGMKLTPDKDKVEVFVIDHIERPTEN